MAKPVVEEFYWLPYCSTCTKAEQHLKDAGIKIKKYINLKEEPVTKATVKKLIKLAGGTEAIFSKRAMKYRAWGLHEKTLSDDEMLDYMVQEYTFIKRPVLVTSDKQILAGFSKKRYDALIEG